MKKTIYFILLLAFSFLIIAKTDKPKKDKNKKNQSNFFFQKNPGKKHSLQNINCKTCHNCEYPTQKEPCLKYCPREGMITVHHSPEECPEIITLDEMSVRFGAVVFSHKLHAQMSEMSDGCQGCHHYNTTGPILACRKCHEQERKRENLRKTDLKGAYHRQCMNCHRQWSHSTDCNNCHLPKTGNVKEKIEKKKIEISGKDHPKTELPDKVIFETGYDKGKLATFYHFDHTEKFKIPCNSCHKDENCIKCHDWNNKLTHTAHSNIKVKANKSFEEHHKLCHACHRQEKCVTCHSHNELEPWEHDRSTRFPLKKHHNKLTCEKCHARKSQFDKLNIECKSCHKNWKQGNFDHKVTGLVLSESHREIECESCHENSNYTSKPLCHFCHDDKPFPKFKPGKFRKVK